MRAYAHLAGVIWTFSATLAVQAEVIPLAVRDGRCEWVQSGNGPSYLILGSLASGGKSSRVLLEREPTSDRPSLVRESTSFARSPGSAVEKWLRLRQTGETFPPLVEPLRRKTFFLLSADRDLESATSYSAVIGELRAVGKRVQVYVDGDDAGIPDLDLTLADITRTVDHELYPWSREKLGQVADVDRDGRFTILLSSRLDRMQGGKVSVDGFVRGSDFLRDVPTPFSNRCDMLYLNARLKAGPHLRTVLAHEFTHAVAFCEHVLFNPPGCRDAEESWLSEGLAHLVEDVHQYSATNLDYRVHAYLAQPERYSLVVPDYFGSGLWRNPGTRGNVYLFLRWCQQQYGPDLPRRLSQSPLTGVRNLEHATQRTFAELFRGWAVSQVAERRPPWPGPHLAPMAPRQEVQLAGTGLKFLWLPATATNQRIVIKADGNCQLQATLVKMPPEHGVVTLRCEARARTLLLTVAAHGSSLRLHKATWEKVLPNRPRREDHGTRPLAVWPHGRLEAGAERRLVLEDFLPEKRKEDVIIKLEGQDAADRSVVGWGYLSASD